MNAICDYSLFTVHFTLFTMLHVALFEPEIPPNTGNIARLCAATFTELHIVGVTGFKMDDRTLKRAGLDYWDQVVLHRHIDLDALYAALPDSRFLFFTTKTATPYTDWKYFDTDCLIFDGRAQGYAKNTSGKTIEQQVFKKLRGLPNYGVFDFISYEVNGDTVVLSGKTRSLGTKSDAASAVKRIPGIARVVNNIEQL